MRKLKARGMGALLEQPRPLSEHAAEALACWRFLGGWQPERLPVWLALHPADDVDALVRRLEAIRDAREECLRPDDDKD